jgi:hypothetical protein
MSNAISPPSEAPGARADQASEPDDTAETHAPNEWNRMVHALGTGLTRRLRVADEAREAIRRLG